MGGVDKSQIQVEGERILHRQLAVLSQRFDAIAIAGSSFEAPEGLSLHSLADRVGGKGPVDGIASGLAWSPEPWLFVVASDMPYLSLALIDALLSRRTPASDIVCVELAGGAEPLFALYHRRLLPLLDTRLAEGMLRARDLVLPGATGIQAATLSEAEVRQIDPELLSFRNLNRPEDVLTSGASIE
jgi:molybdopterin-guanine dinucleotide biosynthesis protein A